MGSSIRIACNGSHWNDDSISLVLWFKGSSPEPIYSVEDRGRSSPKLSGARHHISESFRGRAKFVTADTPPYLEVSPLESDDQGEYRCRIDYRARQRENFLAILFVLG